jgi:transcriptional regulator with XRE-family HTH domain
VIDLFMKITNVKTLRERLIYARELRGFTQSELAKRAKCSQGAIGNVESGDRETLRNLVMVARALHVSSDWLFDGKGEKPEKMPAARPELSRYPEWQESPAAHMAEDERTRVIALPAPKPDKWMTRATEILAQLNEAQRAACVINLELYLAAVGPPKDGQTLQVAG